MTTVLVVSHEASLTGAPRVAIEILHALRPVAERRVVVVRWPGPLIPELASAADRARLEPLRRIRVALRRFRATRRAAVAVEERAARAVLRRERPDLVYLNTVKSASYVRPALEQGLPVVLHSHEVGTLASDTLARYDLAGLYDRVRLVACSTPAAVTLTEITGSDAVAVIPSVVDADRIRRLAGIAAGEEPALTASAPIVLACGTADRRKGVDLWLDVARLVKERTGSGCPRFVWVGAPPAGAVKTQVARMGLGDTVTFGGPTLNPYPAMAAASVVSVPSREDAFPLVVFEAMALGRPVVAFDVGGIAEQVGDTGMLVPAGDVEAMAAAIIRLLGDSGARRRLVEAAAARVEQVFGVEQFRDQVARAVRGELSRKGRRGESGRKLAPGPEETCGT